MSILGTTIWREIVKRKSGTVRSSSEDEETWNGFNMICIIYALGILWILTGEIDNNDGSLMVHGDLRSHSDELVLDCLHEDFSCCTYYDNCSEGPNDTIDYNAYVTTINKGDTCPSFSSIVYSRDHMLGYKNHDCDDTLYGCCYVNVSCEKYGGPDGLQFWSVFDDWVESGSTHNEGDYMKTYIPQIDIEGSNCKTVGEIINEYSQISEKREILTFFKTVFMIIGALTLGILGIFYMIKGIFAGIMVCYKRCKEMRITCDLCRSCNRCKLCKKKNNPKIIVTDDLIVDSSNSSDSLDLEDNRSLIAEYGSPRRHKGVYDEEDAHKRLRGTV